MVECKKCGKPIEEGMEYCPACEQGKPLTDEFNVLYDIDGFDVFEEDKFEAKQKRKKRMICICITAAVLIVALVGIKWAMNKSASYDEKLLKDKTVVEQVQESEKEEDVEEEVIPVVEDEPVEGGNDINKLKEQVMKFCNRYNNGQTLYEGELIATVPNRKTISATYHIPKVLSVEERDAVKEYEEELKNVITEEMKDNFPEEITVNVKMIVSYR